MTDPRTLEQIADDIARHSACSDETCSLSGPALCHHCRRLANEILAALHAAEARGSEQRPPTFPRLNQAGRQACAAGYHAGKRDAAEELDAADARGRPAQDQQEKEPNAHRLVLRFGRVLSADEWRVIAVSTKDVPFVVERIMEAVTESGSAEPVGDAAVKGEP